MKKHRQSQAAPNRGLGDLGSFRDRLTRTITDLTPERFLGVGGLSVVCAASLLALTQGQPSAAALAAWLGSLGLNALAGVVQQWCGGLASQPGRHEQEQLALLARAMAKDVSRDPELRRDIGAFLGTTDALKIAESIAKGDATTYSWLLLRLYFDAEKQRAGHDPIQARLDEIRDLVLATEANPSPSQPFLAPRLPPLVVGRETDISGLKAQMGIAEDLRSPLPVQVMTAVRGCPGVGKTTVASVLAYDPDIALAFPDGVLWASLGQKPDLPRALGRWARALGVAVASRFSDVDEMASQVRRSLHRRRVFLIIDDVWQPEDAQPFLLGGPGCGTLVTTRLPSVAGALAAAPNDVYWLEVLSDAAALELLAELAPEIVRDHARESLQLVRDLGGLPLALQVAGRLLYAEFRLGWGIKALLAELREGTAVLKAQAPASYAVEFGENMPTVAALLRKSTDYLDQETRERFILLGSFAPKPSTFSLAAIGAKWNTPDPRPTMRVLVDRGLVEPAGAGRFQIHALLRMHALSMMKTV